MYEGLVEIIDEAIKAHEAMETHMQGMDEMNKHFFTQGMQVAKQLVAQAEDAAKEFPHEHFDEVVKFYGPLLEEGDLEEAIEAWNDNE